MLLKSIVLENVAVGQVLVCRAPESEPQRPARLVIVQEVGANGVVVVPFAATFDDSEDEDGGGTELHIAQTQLARCLAIMCLEVGDLLFHRLRLARIIDTKENDLHVKIRYEDGLKEEFYGNLIWMDMAPTLTNSNAPLAWPS